MTDIKVYDNFLNVDVFKKIQRQCFSDIHWVYDDTVSNRFDKQQMCDEKYNWQMAHLFYHTPDVISKDTMPILADVYSKLNIAVLIKAKANFNIVTDKIIEHGLHIDVEQIAGICTTAILYLNTNNGYTIFEDGTKVESVANRLVKFPTGTKHSGTSCTDIHNRMVINFNYCKKF